MAMHALTVPLTHLEPPSAPSQDLGWSGYFFLPDWRRLSPEEVAAPCRSRNRRKTDLYHRFSSSRLLHLRISRSSLRPAALRREVSDLFSEEPAFFACPPSGSELNFQQGVNTLGNAERCACTLKSYLVRKSAG
ncbi:hypothetical protein GUJ93_ZPchr0013g35642 [Zizania palustris]|uniref:Uncharacterized protein n=1 Tax=Zizania palustris TaxID=103762 RepID=A0A8J5WWQ1_ZIZPA|nr:hypothetical protein GUJ93_ZPchr0013g35642 [Zizania palustris]